MFQMKDISHENLNLFVGACIDPPNISLMWHYCNKGSLQVCDGFCTTTTTEDPCRYMKIYLQEIRRKSRCRIVVCVLNRALKMVSRVQAKNLDSLLISKFFGSSSTSIRETVSVDTHESRNRIFSLMSTGLDSGHKSNKKFWSR